MKLESTPAAAPRRQRRKEARPGEILEAALTEFVERGYAATRLDDIARRAGLTKAGMYLYFENKDQLFKAVVREHLQPIFADQVQMVETHEGSMRELLERVIRARWKYVVDSPLSGLVKMLMAEANAFPDLARHYHDEVIAPSQALIAGIVRKGSEQGEFRSDLDPAIVARLAVAPIVLAAMWNHSFHKVERQSCEPVAYLDASLQLLFHGLALTTASRRS